MHSEKIIKATMAFVKETLKNAEGGHDWFHIQRVYNNAQLIAKTEKVDLITISLAALLHDIADAKFHGGDETVGPKMATGFLTSIGVGEPVVEHVVEIIKNISYKNTLDKSGMRQFKSRELYVVQDADRLDALGAIGVARAFAYGGFRNRKLYDPNITPNPNMTKKDYKKSNAPTINHFYEKLLLLKDQMNTKTGKRIAQKRHQFLLDYLDQFYAEWNGRA